MASKLEPAISPSPAGDGYHAFAVEVAEAPGGRGPILAEHPVWEVEDRRLKVFRTPALAHGAAQDLVMLMGWRAKNRQAVNPAF